MQTKLTLKRLINEKIAIHCNTSQEVDTLLDRLTELNVPFTEKENSNFYNKYKENTCYTVSEDFIDGVYYGHIDYYMSKGYIIIEFNDLEIS